MPTTITESLQRLESELARLDAPILRRLSPGLEESDIISRLNGLTVPEEVVDLYRWKNGTVVQFGQAIGQAWLFKMGVFMSLERAMLCCGEKAGDDDYWTMGKFPLFESRGGDYYLIETDPASPSYRNIQYYFLGAVDFEVIITKYDSLKSLVLTVTECFRQKAYSYDASTQQLEFDPVLERRINMQYNPGADYWKLFKNGL